MTLTNELARLTLVAACAAALGMPCVTSADEPQAKQEAGVTTTDEAPTTQIIINTDKAPSMAEYGERVKTLGDEWLPKIEAMLPSDGYESPRSITITFDDEMDGVAYATGGNIYCASKWFRERPEDIGAIVHEIAHVVQGYPRGTPGWLVEGIADWVRWFQYEPKDKRPTVTAERAQYNASYRTRAAFLEWARSTYADTLVVDLNAACRAGEYRPELWVDLTGHTVEELGAEWKQSLR